MKRFIKELRRREVFRTAGLYVGICWILIEVGSVLLPTFDAPEWVFRGAIVVAICGFPVMLVMAWFFDVSEQGISFQGDPTDTVVEQLGAHKSDFVVIGVLVVALIVSLSLNVRNEAPVEVKLEPIPVLVSAFQNTTAEPLFDIVLEEALAVGLEVAPNITVVDKSGALQAGAKLKLAGSLQPSGNGYRITLEGVDISVGEVAFTIDEKADSRDAVLQAIGELAAKARKKLGGSAPIEETQTESFMAASLEAASAYAAGRQFERAGELDEAAKSYEQATVADPNLGRAFASLALVERTLGRTDAAAAHWATALTLMDTMTERERLRALGRYDNAVATWTEFVEKYPSDIGARDSYAWAAFQQSDFATAVAETREVLETLPKSHLHRAKLALYAMYNSDWQTAADESAKVIAANPEYGVAYLPVAMAALAEGRVDAAREAYRQMAATSETEHGASVAELGLADIDLYFGEVDEAQERLRAGIDADIESGNDRMAALKYIALAESYADQQNSSAATRAATNAMQLADSVAVQVPAAMIYAEAGDITSAGAIADALLAQPNEHSRAFGQMLMGLILQSEGTRTAEALAMRDAIGTADLWLIRYQAGKAYLRAGHYLEALDELTTLKERRGEAASAFLDNMPTYRFMAEVPYWTGRVQEELNLRSAARASYEQYVALRSQGGALAQDASARAASLSEQ
ncbi:MAG: tetratricopeptide repeat protein [Pseudomonadota bacterium]